jgi:hypothetical protein
MFLTLWFTNGLSSIQCHYWDQPLQRDPIHWIHLKSQLQAFITEKVQASSHREKSHLLFMHPLSEARVPAQLRLHLSQQMATGLVTMWVAPTSGIIKMRSVIRFTGHRKERGF